MVWQARPSGNRMIAERWDTLDAQRQQIGRPLGFADGMIAATALEHGLTLVASNVKDFAGLGVTVSIHGMPHEGNGARAGYAFRGALPARPVDFDFIPRIGNSVGVEGRAVLARTARTMVPFVKKYMARSLSSCIA